MGERSLQKIGGVSAVLEALIYISAFVVYGGVLEYPGTDTSTRERLNFLTDNYTVLSLLNFTSYLVFGILLSVLVLALHHRFKTQDPILSKMASVFGFVWVGLVIASGMIANIGLSSIIAMGRPILKKPWECFPVSISSQKALVVEMKLWAGFGCCS